MSGRRPAASIASQLAELEADIEASATAFSETIAQEKRQLKTLNRRTAAELRSVDPQQADQVEAIFTADYGEDDEVPEEDTANGSCDNPKDKITHRFDARTLLGADPEANIAIRRGLDAIAELDRQLAAITRESAAKNESLRRLLAGGNMDDVLPPPQPISSTAPPNIVVDHAESIGASRRRGGPALTSPAVTPRSVSDSMSTKGGNERTFLTAKGRVDDSSTTGSKRESRLPRNSTGSSTINVQTSVKSKAEDGRSMKSNKNIDSEALEELSIAQELRVTELLNFDEDEFVKDMSYMTVDDMESVRILDEQLNEFGRSDRLSVPPENIEVVTEGARDYLREQRYAREAREAELRLDNMIALTRGKLIADIDAVALTRQSVGHNKGNKFSCDPRWDVPSLDNVELETAVTADEIDALVEKLRRQFSSSATESATYEDGKESENPADEAEVLEESYEITRLADRDSIDSLVNDLCLELLRLKDVSARNAEEDKVNMAASAGIAAARQANVDTSGSRSKIPVMTNTRSRRSTSRSRAVELASLRSRVESSHSHILGENVPTIDTHESGLRIAPKNYEDSERWGEEAVINVDGVDAIVDRVFSSQDFSIAANNAPKFVSKLEFQPDTITGGLTLPRIPSARPISNEGPQSRGSSSQSTSRHSRKSSRSGMGLPQEDPNSFFI